MRFVGWFALNRAGIVRLQVRTPTIASSTASFEDGLLERTWRARVAVNEERRRMLSDTGPELPLVFRRQAL